MIREARPTDEPALERLRDELREYDSSLLSYAISGPPLVLVAGEIDGYLIALLGEEAYLAELVVHPGKRRRGIATALLGALRDRGRESGSEAIELVVHPDDEGAIALYESNGYERVGVREAFYADSDGIVMRRAV